MKADKRGCTQITNSPYLDYAVPAAMNPLPSGVEQESSGDDDYGDFAFVSGWGVLGLLVGQKSLGLYALIGVVLLMGIVTKNSILLVDYQENWV